MIRLLLVDDEDFTREGIKEKIHWNEIGIDQIFEADDGINALDTALREVPDIVVTDVRMPRMNGIDLAFKLRELYPECFIIFMSGYSDKEYLKSAIKVSAVSYVEKPIDLDELQGAIANAVVLYKDKKKHKQEEQEREQLLKTSIPAAQNDIALKLSRKTGAIEPIISRLQLIAPYIPAESSFRTLIIRIVAGEEKESDWNGDNTVDVLNAAAEIIEEAGLRALYGIRDDFNIIVHCCPEVKDSEHGFRNDTGFIRRLAEILNRKWNVFIAVGKPASGVQNIYESYNSAVLALQKSFYHPEDIIFVSGNGQNRQFQLQESGLTQFAEYLSAGDMHQCLAFQDNLHAVLREYDDTPVSYVKDYYYKLAAILYRTAGECKIPVFSSETGLESLREKIFSFTVLEDLKQFLMEKTEELFSNLAGRAQNSTVAAEVLDFIHKNYKDQSLCLGSISSHFSLSSSYICVIFKEETQKTINQYLTEYRIERAKALLKNRRLKVKDIAEEVGYSGSNYFSKAFRKITGMTPIEFRERFRP